MVEVIKSIKENEFSPAIYDPNTDLMTLIKLAKEWDLSLNSMIVLKLT